MFPSRFHLVFLIIFFVAAASAQTADGGSTTTPEGVGKVSFAISCATESRSPFEKGVALLHSFQYEASQKSFDQASHADPNCAMAYWGLAMSGYKQLWDGATEKALSKGGEYLEKAKKLGTVNQREKEYIKAADGLFSSGGSPAERIARYSHAMAELSRKYPDDVEASAFYALSLLALPGKANGETNRKMAIAILNKLSAAHPEHPGAAHYLIHATDTPEHAAAGLEAARRYARIAPASSHALHMPSHIFVRLGLWQESIDSNLAAATSAAEATEQHMGDFHYQFHAMDFLDYSYLQSGQHAKARQIVEDLSKVPGRAPDATTNSSVLLRTRNAIETHRWRDALVLAPEGDAYSQQVIYAVRTIAAARLGDSHEAENNFRKMKDLYKHSSQKEKLSEVRRSQAEASLEFARGKREKALKILRAAADHEDASDPGSFFPPAREMLGDLLLELHQPAQALAEYEAELKLSPNRFNGLFGAATAAHLSGDSSKSENYSATLREICGPKADREELHSGNLAALKTN